MERVVLDLVAFEVSSSLAVMLRRLGRSSESLTNCPYSILFTSFAGIGGIPSPTQSGCGSCGGGVFGGWLSWGYIMARLVSRFSSGRLPTAG